jgi:hypothetical protein
VATDALVWLAPLSALTFGAIGLLVGWAVWAPERLRFPPPPEPPPPPPRGLCVTTEGVVERFAARCRETAEELTRSALVEAGADPGMAPALAEQSPTTAAAEGMLLGLVQAGWVDGARSLALAVQTSSPFRPELTERLLDLGHRAMLSPAEPA